MSYDNRKLIYDIKQKGYLKSHFRPAFYKYAPEIEMRIRKGIEK